MFSQMAMVGANASTGARDSANIEQIEGFNWIGNGMKSDSTCNIIFHF